MAGDSLDKSKRAKTIGEIGSKVPVVPAVQHAVTAPSVDVVHDPVKDAERLKQLRQRPAYVRLERNWLDLLEPRMRSAVLLPVRKLGYGPWRKKYQNEAALTATLDLVLRPALELCWRAPLDAVAWVELPGEPALHPAYEPEVYGFGGVGFDEIKHVAHAYVMTLAHAWFRVLLYCARSEGVDATFANYRVPRDMLYVLEVNFCQYYVPHTTVAYFEAQPLRALAREIANRFRKVAFGGQ